MNRPVIAILASGEGTTAEAFIRASAAGQIEPVVGLVIASNPKAGILQRVANLNNELGLSIQTLVIGRSTHPPSDSETLSPGQQSKAEEQALLEVLRAGRYAAIVLMGYMKKIGPTLVHEFGWRNDYTSPYQATMLNTHPGLLPATEGLFGVHVQERVLEVGLKEAGQTLHVVAEGYDDGPVVAENMVPVLEGDTPDSLFDRVRAVEREKLPVDVAEFIKKGAQ